jgi:uncharacterized protein YdaU (DUF1376 family)
MRKAPAIPLFGDAYLADTRHLSLEEHGAYLQLLMIAWRMPNCAIPDDDKRLAMMLSITPKKWATLKPQVMAFWNHSEAGWQQKRLLKERRFVAKKSEDNRDAANARWNAKSLENNDPDDANAMPNLCETDAPPPSPSEEGKKEEEGGATAPRGKYVFRGRVIRLTQAHYDEWRKTYHAIADHKAELSTIDDWLVENPREDGKWFHHVKGMLNRKHQEILQSKKAERDEPFKLTV